MKKQIYDIVFSAQYEGLSTKEATDKLLLLFSVTRSTKADDEQEIIDAYMKEAKKYYPKKKQIRL